MLATRSALTNSACTSGCGHQSGSSSPGSALARCYPGQQSRVVHPFPKELMLVLLLLNYLAPQLMFEFVPLSRRGTPPGPYVNFGLFALTILGLILSLRSRPIRN